ncbi:BnaC09g54370D [Brassica napus]|uniref:BnaC09g54370D protein n=2 Tax=Brassica napus TaxID=3708 RepID=A0A078ITF6_BRANA|nr:BnaC09g54370D [Brassica napus]
MGLRGIMEIRTLKTPNIKYLQASVVVTEAKRAKRVILPELLVKHAADFVGARADSSCGEMGYLVKWVCNQLPTSGSLRKSMVKLRKHSKQEGVYENTVPPNNGETVKGHISDRAA